MPKTLRTDLSDQILLYLAAQPSGAGIDAIADRFTPVASKRTLQRRLQDLIRAGRVATSGDARSLKYRVPQAIYGSGAAQAGPATVSGVAESYPPLSPPAADLRSMVERPKAMRQPVSYHREFLEDYRPNDTAWLEPAVRSHLRRIGEAANADHAAGTYARSILTRLLVDLSWASSRLEGNTYSLLETERLIELGETPDGKAALETQMILNHKAAIEMIVDGSADPEMGVNAYTVRNLHALLANNLLADAAAGGRVRHKGSVNIGGSVYLPLDGGPLLEQTFSRLLKIAESIDDPFEQAFFLMVQLPYLQPFEDVNKRVSRLAANIPLIKHDLCPLSFIELPQRPYIDGLLAVYELNRVELLRDVFIWAYERSARRYSAIQESLGQPDLFRLRNRNQLYAIVRHHVLAREWPTPEAIAAMAREQRVVEAEVDHFVRLVQGELEALHEGNFARFKLRPSEYEAWRVFREQARPRWG